MALLVTFAGPKVQVKHEGLLRRTAPAKLKNLLSRLSKQPYQPVKFLAEILDAAGYDKLFVDEAARGLFDQVAKKDLCAGRFGESFDALCREYGWSVARIAYEYFDLKLKRPVHAFVVVAEPTNRQLITKILDEKYLGGRTVPAFPSGGNSISRGGFWIGPRTSES